MKARIIFRWYALWIGIYIDRIAYQLYFFPVPMLGVRIDIQPVLAFIIERIFIHFWDGRGRFYKGDKVKFNWMARVCLPTTYKMYKECPRTIYMLTSDLKKAVFKTNSGGTYMVDVFWLTKCKE